MEQEIEELHKKGEKETPLVTKEAIKQLKDMGLMPMNIPDDLFSLQHQNLTPKKDERRKAGLTEEDQGKDKPYNTLHCSCSSGEKNKLKSGKYVKSNINIKIQEQWPHMNV